VKKSTVATIARSGAIWKTAASSRLEAVDEDPGIRRDRHVAQDLRQLG